MITWLYVHLGLSNPSGAWYLWWSGIGANFQEFALLGVIYAVWRRHNCHVDRCWRLGKHDVDGTPYVVCAKHHPTIVDTQPVTAESIAVAHELAQNR